MNAVRWNRFGTTDAAQILSSYNSSLDVLKNYLPQRFAFLSKAYRGDTYFVKYDIGAYEAYEPKFIRGKSFDEVLTGHKGAVLLLANEEMAQKLAHEYGGEVVAHDYAYHEYSSRWFDFCIIDFK